MKKVYVIIGSIEIILGSICLIITSLIKQILPKLARMCFMFNNGGFSPSDYIIDTRFAGAIAIGLCILGVFTIIAKER